MRRVGNRPESRTDPGAARRSPCRGSIRAPRRWRRSAVGAPPPGTDAIVGSAQLGRCEAVRVDRPSPHLGVVHELPLLVLAARAVGLHDRRRVLLAGPGDVETLLAVTRHELVVAGVGGDELPLLVLAAPAGALYDRRRVLLAGPLDIQALGAV